MAVAASVDWVSSLLISFTVSVFNDLTAVSLVCCSDNVVGFVVDDDS